MPGAARGPTTTLSIVVPGAALGPTTTLSIVVVHLSPWQLTARTVSGPTARADREVGVKEEAHWAARLALLTVTGAGGCSAP